MADALAPRLIRRENGGWLALSATSCPARIGVEAWSADEALNRLYRAHREWDALLEGGVNEGDVAPAALALFRQHTAAVSRSTEERE